MQKKYYIDEIDNYQFTLPYVKNFNELYSDTEIVEEGTGRLYTYEYETWEYFENLVYMIKKVYEYLFLSYNDGSKLKEIDLKLEKYMDLQKIEDIYYGKNKKIALDI